MLRQLSKLRIPCDTLLSLGISRKQKTTLFSLKMQKRGNRGIHSTAPPKRWDLVSAVCLERHPRITKCTADIETQFLELLKLIESENSMKCDYEIKFDAQKGHTKLQERNSVEIDATMSIQAMQEIEDGWQKELHSFQFAPRFEEKHNDTTSVKHRLDKSLLLLVEQQIGNCKYWLPPQSLRKQGETMRQAADRTLQDFCGTKLNVKFYGNAPIGFYKYKYPKEVQIQGSHGAKVFYFLAKYIDGTVCSQANHGWFDHDEAGKNLPSDVRRCIYQFLLLD